MKIKYYYCIIIILVSLLIACGNAEKKPTLTVPMDAKAGSVFLEADIYKVDDTEFKAQSGFIVVSENRSKPDSRLIEIPIIQVHATGDSVAEPIFFLGGGPGNRNIGSFHFEKN